MEIEKKKPTPSSPHHIFPLLLSSPMPLLLVLLLLSTTASAAPLAAFTPQDNVLINAGATSSVPSPDGRKFKTDQEAASFLKTNNDEEAILVAAQNGGNDLPSPIYLTARIFTKESTYTFDLTHPGFHWIRLHFFPIENNRFNLTEASFSVTTERFVLLHSFKPENTPTKTILKEFLINIESPKLSLNFIPMKNSAAFINAIEIVSVPDSLITDQGSNLFPVNTITGLQNFGYQIVHRLNMGGPTITSQNDTLNRNWLPDQPFLKDPKLATNVSVSTTAVQYTKELTPLIAPATVYATAEQMGNADTARQNFNVTWQFNDLNPAFDYLLRLHFCDIISKAMNDLYFNVYINGKMAVSGLDLSSLTGGLATPYYKDVVVNTSTMMSTDGLSVQIGPMNGDSGARNALLNGLEVMKMSNSVDSLDGEFGVDGQRVGSGSRRAVAAVGFAMMFGAFVGLGAMVIRWKRRPQDWQRRNSFSSWLLPIHAGETSFMSGSKGGSQKSAFFNSTMGLGRYFSLSELQEATKNFDSSTIIGVGGFGNVYFGEIDDGTKVAVKRGNPQSEQGITEFHTEIQMLSKLRHRHLVSLIGYCDENNEMILVYEYMLNGPFRDHLYGKDLPALSWKQRLEISIGAARGLHYLHTGTTQGIIHRDVKTTNILLDEAFVAKVSDFGLSKDGPMGQGQNYVSTAVKGSFGYLDPEYFRRQQLTDKSDVYSFGVVLLEVLCARPALNPQLPREQVNLAEWAMQWKRKEMLEKITDPHLAGTVNPESIKKFAEAAEKCLADYGVDRPTMGDVLWNLEYALQLQDSWEADQDDSKATAEEGKNIEGSDGTAQLNGNR